MVGFGARWVAGLAALAVSLSAATAVAGDFDERGVYSFAPGATARYDFEDGAPEPVDDQADPISVVSSESALRGSHVVTLGPFQSVDLFVDPEAGQRTYRASVWVRGNDSAGYLVVSHDEENRAVEVVSLYPTGRVTSDGWVELANERIPIDGARSSAVITVAGGCQRAIGHAVEAVGEGNHIGPAGHLAGQLQGCLDGVGARRPAEHDLVVHLAWLQHQPLEGIEEVRLGGGMHVEAVGHAIAGDVVDQRGFHVGVVVPVVQR